jgi:hypothetical protein
MREEGTSATRLVEGEVIEAIGDRIGDMISIEREPVGAKCRVGFVPMESGGEKKLDSRTSQQREEERLEPENMKLFDTKNHLLLLVG